MKSNIMNILSTSVHVVLALTILGATNFEATARLRANGKIAFTSDRDGNKEIYLMDADGTNQKRLTDNNFVDDDPTWSPDGKKIAFLSQNELGALAIFVMNGDGTAKTEITPVSVTEYHDKIISWSPDGRQLVINHANGIDIVDADDSNRRFLTSGSNPAWSPDGSKILFVGSDGLANINPDGTGLHSLSLLGFYPDWSPDGLQITYLRFDGANQIILVANSDGTDAHDFAYECGGLSPHGCSYIVSVDWSPDGSKFVYGAWRTLYTIDQNSNGRTVLTTPGIKPSWQPLISGATADFDGDGRSDVSVFRPSDRTWYLGGSSAGFSAAQFGISSDQITPGDFDGDGETDLAVWRPSEGTWYIQQSTAGFTAVQWGISTDLPVPSDFDGDGKTDIAVWRPSTGVWFVLNSGNGQTSAMHFGLGGDKPVPGDYDGDGKTDHAVYRPSDGVWYLMQSSAGFKGLQFGISTDRVVPADYDGDGKYDPAVYRDGTWYLQQSGAGFAIANFGLASDIPVPADYDGDGKADVSVLRPSSGIWYSQRSESGFLATQFGQAGDKPVPAALIPLQ